MDVREAAKGSVMFRDVMADDSRSGIDVVGRVGVFWGGSDEMVGLCN
jgi:hypothetical protein